MTPAKDQYVHVLSKETGKSIQAIGPTKDPERVARGVAINMDHDRFELAIGDSPVWDG